MKSLHKCSVGRLALGCGVIALALSLTSSGRGADENIGKVQQGLVGGEEVSEKMQESYGLLSLDSGGSCSASLLRNDWAISAAHCVDAKDTNDNPMKDPTRPGQNILKPIGGFSVKAAWGGGQTKRVTKIDTFWPYDVALLKLDSPMQINGQTKGFAREVFVDQFPYFGTVDNLTLKVFGRGINQFATGTGNSAMPSQSDNKFRVGTVQVSKNEGALYWYPTKGKLMIAGGDSGGPSFATAGVNKQTVLVGVHALTLADYVPGKPTKGWKWVTATREAADAPLKPVWPQILKIMGPLPAPPPEPFTGRHSAIFENTVPFSTAPTAVHHILYGVKHDGTLVWHRHMISGDGKHSWNPTQNVGTGWKAGYSSIMPAGMLAMYALQDDGTLRWYWHTGVNDGSYRWRNPQTVGTGWNSFTQIIPMDNGVVYGILPDGYLRWHQHVNYQNGNNGVNGWKEAKKVGWGWNGFKAIFSGGNGILYVVKQDGTLMWYNHKSYLNPPEVPASDASNAVKLNWQNSWAEPKAIGNGWGGFTKLFSSGEGNIYGILENGDLMWYRHTGWKTGAASWDAKGRVKIAGGWDAYAFAFARIETSDAGNRETDIIVN